MVPCQHCVGAGPRQPDCIFVGVVNAADDTLRCRELSRSFTRIALPSKTIPHASALIGLPRGPQADRTEELLTYLVRQFFASRENDDFINCLFSAPCRWLCIRALVEEALV